MLSDPVDPTWLRFHADQFQLQLRTTTASRQRGVHEPAPVAGPELNHRKRPVSLETRLQHINPLEVLLVEAGIACLDKTRRRKFPATSGEHARSEGIPCHHAKKVGVVTSGNETRKALEIAEDRMVHAIPPRGT